MLFILPFIILTLLFWIWMLVDCISSKLDTTNKLIWLLVILFFNFLGALLYFILVKSNKNYRGFEIKMKTNKKTKKLYRSKNNRVIAGICGGIGEYFDIDPTIIRLLWVLFTFMGGSGIIAYIICWIVIPEKK
ncbi:MAG: PspC domain-containing protein [Nanoarchaeota archaeon]|nr:PspC domain-containing protein [Nanoarchaeota archaeon]MBU1004216.1 PspC domain-containing protein [Nanoarchaeota archaeon]